MVRVMVRVMVRAVVRVMMRVWISPFEGGSLVYFEIGD